MTTKIQITMTRTEALKAGLLACRCGHRPNNHFGSGACAMCGCKKYDEHAVVGTLAAPSPAPVEPSEGRHRQEGE